MSLSQESEAKKPLDAKWTFNNLLVTGTHEDTDVIVKITPDARFRGGDQAKFRGHLDVEVGMWAEDEQLEKTGPLTDGQNVVKLGKWLAEENVFEFKFQGVVIKHEGPWHYIFSMQMDNGPHATFEVGTAVSDNDFSARDFSRATRN